MFAIIIIIFIIYLHPVGSIQVYSRSIRMDSLGDAVAIVEYKTLAGIEFAGLSTMVVVRTYYPSFSL
jgi:hypothetical protein